MQGTDLNPFGMHQLQHGGVDEVPDPIEFIVSDKYLDRPNLYPRQATFIKVIFLRDDMFTQYDLDVIGEWEETFRVSGNEGISPDIMERIRICKAAGRPWFRETLAVVGRRGSKGYTGALAGSYVLWNYMHRPGGPQSYYGIDRDKRLTAIVFAGKKEQAVANQWRDLTNIILGGPCFSKYISKAQAERLTVFAPNDMLRAIRQDMLGVRIEGDIASFEILPSSSTMMAGRGPTSFMQFYDEMAHVVATGANRDAEAVYTAATPSLDQFGVDAFLYEPSSPWTMTGQFFANWEKAIAEDADGTPSFPEMLMLQLPSWGPYEDWERAHTLPMRPGKKTIIEIETRQRSRKKGVPGKVKVEQVEQIEPAPVFQPLRRAIQTYDDQMKQLEKANPDTFSVERRSHWAESLAQYLNKAKVLAAFAEEWNGQAIIVQDSASLAIAYVAHGDPATSNKRFGWALGHRVWDEEREMYHAVLDVIRCWDPSDWDDHLIDYDDVMEDIESDVKVFSPESVTFDQFNVPATIGRLRKFVAKAHLPRMVTVGEVVRTRPVNWKHYELFKSALNMDLVHIPMKDRDGEVNFASEQAELELRFLEEKNGAVDHPSSGPVQTKDIADAICEVVVMLIGEQIAAFLGQEFEGVGIRGTAPGGTDPYRHQAPEDGNTIAALAAATSRGSRGGRGGMAQPRSRSGMRTR